MQTALPLQQGESYADTFNTLTGYENSIFVIRSKLEGVCRWLQAASAEYAERNSLPFTPSFINAGDGKHEHPTQELLDEFTFLEDNEWKTDSNSPGAGRRSVPWKNRSLQVDGLTLFRFRCR